MLTTIKDFVGGIVTDGDSPDLPPNSSRVLNNFDIDKSTQKLVVRHPFYPYTELGVWPAVTGFFPYHVIQYTVGIVEPIHNTLVVLRSRNPVAVDPYRWDWWVYDNGPNGGDGQPFEPIYLEAATTDCNPSAVLGNVRLALGNDHDFRIIHRLPATDYFSSSGSGLLTKWLVGMSSLEDDVTTSPATPGIVSRQNGLIFSKKTADDRPYLYLDGRLYPSAGGNSNLVASSSLAAGVYVSKGKYDFIISPVFDNFPQQYGAPVATASVQITEEPKELPVSNINTILAGASYQVNQVYGFGWRKYTIDELISTRVANKTHPEWNAAAGYAVGNIRIPFAGKTALYSSSHEGLIFIATNNSFGGFSRGDLVMFRGTGTISKSSSLCKIVPKTEYVTYIKSLGPVAGAVTIDANTPDSFFLQNDVCLLVDLYVLEEIPTLEFAVEHPTDSQYYTTQGNRLTISPLLTNPADWKVDIPIHDTSTDTYVEQERMEDVYGPIPYYPKAQTIINPDSTLLFLGSGFTQFGDFLGRKKLDGSYAADITPNLKWFLSLDAGDYVHPYLTSKKLKPLITPIKAYEGLVVNLAFDVDLSSFNPRLLEYAVFMRYTPAGLAATGDYNIIKLLGVRSDSRNSVNWSPIQTISRQAALYTLTVDAATAGASFGTWGEKYDVDGVGFRPYDHTLEDITRRMRQMIPMRDRMHAIGIDGDEGQELVGRTPVSAGQSQLDVWFKPLIAHAGKGLAVLSAIEFQDRLVWFQRNNLIHGSFGDSRRAADYQFMSTGGIAGTHLTRTIAKSNDAIFFANYDGIFRFDGSRPTDITTGRINDYWRYGISKAQKDVAVAGFNKKTNEYWLYIPDDPEQYARLQEITYNPNDPSVATLSVGLDAANIPFYGRVWIWDDNDNPARSWRTYTLDALQFQDLPILSTFSPALFLCDKDDNWIFVNSFASSVNNAYFWPGESYIHEDPHYPISFAMQTQNLGERNTDLIPDMFRLVGEDSPLDYDLTVNIFRDNTTADTETLTLKALNRRQRRLDRRRSSTLRIGISGVYNPLTQVNPVTGNTLYQDSPHTTDQAKAALQELYAAHRPEIREIHFDVLPNPRRT